MNHETRWGFDIDSVVGDLSAVLEKVAREEYGLEIRSDQFTEFRLETCLPYDPEFIEKWVDRALDPQWTARMEPYPDAVEVLTVLAKRQPLIFVTARSERGPILDWLRGCLRNVPAERICVEAVGGDGCKLPALRRWAVSHFVEDRLETCHVISHGGILPLVFEQPWNAGRHEYPAVRNWREIDEWIQDRGNGGSEWRG
jgi:uncharacterized HAD superfamily protein